MSKLAELLQSRGVQPATSATPATHEHRSSKSSESSRGEVSKSKLAPDLEHRIRVMARRWQFSDADLADFLARALRDPAGCMRAVALDERREQEFRERGWLPRTDA